MRQLSVVAACLAALCVASIGAATAAPADPSAPPPPSDDLSQQIDPEQDVATDDAVLESGHVDLGPRYVDGAWTLMVHDDTRRRGSVWRPLDSTVVRIRDTATQQVPGDPAYEFLGVEPGTPVHVVPQTQNPDVVWLGWNTQDPEVMATVDRGVTLSLAGVDGPGNLVVYLQDGGFGAPDVLWDSRVAEEQPLWVDVNTHTHANWVFTEPGVYLVSIRTDAVLVDGTETSTLGTLRVAVGDETAPAQALEAEATGPLDDPGNPDETAAGGGAGEDSAGEGVPVAVPLAAGAAVLVVALAVLMAWGRRTRARALGGGEE